MITLVSSPKQRLSKDAQHSVYVSHTKLNYGFNFRIDASSSAEEGCFYDTVYRTEYLTVYETKCEEK